MTTNLDDRIKRWVHDATWKVAAQFDGLGNLTINDIARLVARSFNVVVTDITSRSQFFVDVAARNVTMVLACRFTDMSTTDIGNWCSVREITVDRACALYDNMIDELFRELDLSIPPRRLSMNSRDLSVLMGLYSSSADGEFSCPEDIIPQAWSAKLGTRTLNRLKDFGLAELKSELNLHWWRITDAGRGIITNQHERSRALSKHRILQRQRRLELLKEAA